MVLYKQIHKVKLRNIAFFKHVYFLIKYKNYKNIFNVQNTNLNLDRFQSMLDCHKAESGKYAKSCAKRGGLFKCCANT